MVLSRDKLPGWFIYFFFIGTVFQGVQGLEDGGGVNTLMKVLASHNLLRLASLASELYRSVIWY